MKLLVIFGTRPEAIKMAPLVNELKKSAKLEIKVCITAQHREMLDQVLQIFELKPDFDLNLMRSKQSLTQLTCGILDGVQGVFEKFRPEWVLVHGDTTTTLSASLAAYYHQIKVAHIEAGLRTNDLKAPWPEEGNRQITARLAELNFAPTDSARYNLIREGVSPDKIIVTGNTVIDALISTKEKILNNEKIRKKFEKKFEFIDFSKKIILVTGHRRENFGAGFESICNALLKIAEEKDVQIVYPVHLNPNVSELVNKLLSGKKNIFLIDPLEYMPFIYLMNKCYMVLTDSGGIQEEAPSLGKPVLVMRDKTERQEAVDAKTVMVVGTASEKIVKKAIELLKNKKIYKQMSLAHNPYGSGDSCIRIRGILERVADKVKGR